MLVIFMSKTHIKHSLERDAYLSRRENRETTLQNLHKTVERLSKLMPMSQEDKDELFDYAEQLLEERVSKERRQRGKSNEVLAEPTANTSRQDSF
jgi:hypothetical protein